MITVSFSSSLKRYVCGVVYPTLWFYSVFHFLDWASINVKLSARRSFRCTKAIHVSEKHFWKASMLYVVGLWFVLMKNNKKRCQLFFHLDICEILRRWTSCITALLFVVSLFHDDNHSSKRTMFFFLIEVCGKYPIKGGESGPNQLAHSQSNHLWIYFRAPPINTESSCSRSCWHDWPEWAERSFRAQR